MPAGADVLATRTLATGVRVRIEEAPRQGSSSGDLLLSFAVGGIVTSASERPELQREFFRRRATVTADFTGCLGLAATIFPGNYFIKLGRQDELLGHAAFDDRFIVKTSDPADRARAARPGDRSGLLSRGAATPAGRVVADPPGAARRADCGHPVRARR